jgi:cytochrome c
MVRTMKRIASVGVAILALSTAAALGAEADPGQGARVFRACAACHSLEANRNMTGPSLAGVWNRKAGGLASFTRYSDAMKLSGITWDEQSLDGYLKNPAEFMPGNHMTFPGIPDDQARASVIAFLKSGAEPPKENQTCPYHKSNPYVLMVQPSENGPHLDAPGALNEPSNRRILA